jgi:hypothetical protein
MSTTHTYWQNALSGNFGAVHENDPQCGYYRMRKGRGGPWVPVAIWLEDHGSVRQGQNSINSDSGKLVCLVEGKERNAYDVWTWVCRYPIAYETYVAVSEDGEPWPEEVPALGHNSQSLNEAEVVGEEVEALSLSAMNWLETLPTIENQSDADKAANYADRLSALETRAEEARVIEKRPSLEEGREIDARWKPVVSKAQDVKAKMKKAIEPYLVGERQRRIEMARLTFQGSESGFDPSDIEPPRAGTNGRRVGLRSKYTVKITEPSALMDYYRTDLRLWSDKAVKEAIAKLAEADLASGAQIQGATLMEEFLVV